MSQGCSLGVDWTAFLSGAWDLFSISRGDWRNSVPYGCRNDVLVLLLSVRGFSWLLEAPSSLPRGCLVVPLTTWKLASSRPVEESLSSLLSLRQSLIIIGVTLLSPLPYTIG